jgi:hypothetical protein
MSATNMALEYGSPETRAGDSGALLASFILGAKEN